MTLATTILPSGSSLTITPTSVLAGRLWRRIEKEEKKAVLGLRPLNAAAT